MSPYKLVPVYHSLLVGHAIVTDKLLAGDPWIVSVCCFNLYLLRYNDCVYFIKSIKFLVPQIFQIKNLFEHGEKVSLFLMNSILQLQGKNV